MLSTMGCYVLEVELAWRWIGNGICQAACVHVYICIWCAPVTAKTNICTYTCYYKQTTGSLAALKPLIKSVYFYLMYVR